MQRPQICNVHHGNSVPIRSVENAFKLATVFSTRGQYERKVAILLVSCAKNHDIERRRAVVKLPRVREKGREEDTVCSVVHSIFSRDVISEIHTR